MGAVGVLGLAAVISYGTTRLVRGVEPPTDGTVRLAAAEAAARPDAAQDVTPASEPDRPEHTPSPEATSLLREAMARPLDDGASSLGEAPPPPEAGSVDGVVQVPEAVAQPEAPAEDAAPKPGTSETAESATAARAGAATAGLVRHREPKAPRRPAPRAAESKAATVRPARAAGSVRPVEAAARAPHVPAAARRRDDKLTAAPQVSWQLPSSLAPSP